MLGFRKDLKGNIYEAIFRKGEIPILEGAKWALIITAAFHFFSGVVALSAYRVETS